MSNKTYKCPHCLAISPSLMYDVFIESQRTVLTNVETGEVVTGKTGPDDYDRIHPVWTICTACGVTLLGDADHYVIDCDAEGASD